MKHSIALTLSDASDKAVRVKYTLVSGTATAGADFTAATAYLSFAPGSTTASLDVSILEDVYVEGSESFTVVLSDPENATLGTLQVHTVTILDDGDTIVAPAGAFTITGATGGADVTANAYLTFGNEVTANWSASVGAVSYNVTVFENDGTTVKCAQQSTASTLFTFTGCLLAEGTTYKIKAVALNSDSVGTVATNDLFPFTVDTIAPTITAFIVTNSSPTKSTAYNLTFTGAGAPSQYCILENDTDDTHCSWQATPLPTSFTVNTTNNAKTLYAWVRDAAGNTSARSDSASVTLDTVAPLITTFAITNSSPTNSTTYGLTFSASGTPSLYCILENDTDDTHCSWQATPLPTSFIVNTTNNAKTLSAWLKDAAGNMSARSDSAAVTLDTQSTAPSGLALQNPSFSPASDTTPTIRASGVSSGDIVRIYNSSACNTTVLGTATSSGVTVDVTTSALAIGTYTLYATTEDPLGNVSACSSASVGYQVVAASPPSNSYISINLGARYTTSTSVVLTLSAYNATQMYVTNVAGCGSGGAWETYSPFKTWTLPNAGASNTVWVRYMSSTGDTGSCTGSSITHDGTAPDAPTGLTNGAVPSDLTKAPTFSWTASSDNAGGTGVSYYSVQIKKVSDNSVVVPWRALSSGSQLTSINLASATGYYWEAKAVDYAGNSSAVATGSSWTTLAAPAAPSYAFGQSDYSKLGLGVAPNILQPGPPLAGGLAFAQIASGGTHSCGVTNSGDAYCWGGQYYGKLGNGVSGNVSYLSAPTLVLGGLKWNQVTAGSNHSCGITTAGAAYCWGDDGVGQLGNGAGTTGDQTSPTLVSGGFTWVKISTHIDHTCGITTSGDAYCWGDATNGRLGNGATSGTQTSPALVNGGYKWREISAGGTHTCGITIAGDAYCWGSDTNGQLGNGAGTTGDQSAPTLVSGGLIWSRISASLSFTCATTSAAVAYCWGSDGYGQLGNGAGTTADQVSPSAVSGGGFWSAIDAGPYRHACGIKAGAMYCWGYQPYGGLGNGSVNSQSSPTLVSGGYTWSAVSVGSDWTCGITDTNNSYCWGWGIYGQLGDGPMRGALAVALPIAGGYSWAQLAAGSDYSCGIASTGAAYCWGDDSYGRLGNGATSGEQSSPSLVSGGQTWSQLATRYQHSCGITTGGQAYCWGRGDFGQLGIGSTATLNAPGTAVTLPGGVTSWQKISVGDSHSCAIADTGDAYCWGSDTYGQLGNGAGTTGDQTTPTLVAGAHTWTQISAGSEFTCGLSGTSVYCWGRDSQRQLGQGGGTATDQPSPTLVTGAWTKIAAGSVHACAIENATNALYCWGNDTYGQLGNGTGVSGNQASPSAVTGGLSWSAVSAGTSHTCGLVGSTLYCFGWAGAIGYSASISNQSSPVVSDGGYSWTSISAGATHNVGTITP